MRVKNKELRQRRHRKEQKIKEAQRAIKAEFGDKKPTPAAEKTAPKKAPAKKTEAAKAPAAKKPAAPKAKKDEATAE